MPWTGTDFEFDEEIDPEQERLLNTKKNQNWANHLPTKSSFKCRPWTPTVGYTCVYESWFNNCLLWWPLPEFLTTYFSRRKIALGQYTANGIRILVTLTVLAAEIGYNDVGASLRGTHDTKYHREDGIRLWEDGPQIQYRLGKWSQGGSQSFLEEVEAIRTLTETSVETPLRSRNQRMGKLNLASLSSYADTIGTPVHGCESSGDGRPAKRRRSSNVDEGDSHVIPIRSPHSETPEEHLGDDGQEPSLEETPSLDPVVEAEAAITTEVLTEEHLMDPSTGEEPKGDQFQEPDPTTHGDEVVEYPHLIDFKYQHIDVLFVEDHEEPARLFRQIKLKKKGMPVLEQLKLEPSKEIAKLAYKCGTYEEQVGKLEAEKNEAVERAKLERSRNELLFKELEELKAQKLGLDTRCQNLEQEKSEVELRFKMTTRRLG
ncbi:hypothetical protein N665_0098s0062 [Sinapis alba]|nr:hypothetical protein N665_0098s0062 [Sinapis alba]